MKPIPSTADQIETALDATQTMGNEGKLSLGLLVRLFTANSGRPDNDATGRSVSAAQAVFAPVHSVASFNQRLDLAQELGLEELELTQAGNPSGARFLLQDRRRRRQFLTELESRGLRISALNCSGMPLHPVDGSRYVDVIRTTLHLASEFGVRTIVGMSGTGSDGPDSSTINWVFYPWPPSSVALAKQHWKEAATLWTEIAKEAETCDVTRIALELHPLHVVYNVPTLERLRDLVGPIIGATLDPSHLIWQQMDPGAVATALRDKVFHVQLKDTAFVPEELATAGVLDDRPFNGTEHGHSAQLGGAMTPIGGLGSCVHL